MRRLRITVLSLALLGTWPLTARAQTATVTLGDPEWSGRPATELREDQINRADCLAMSAKIAFSVTVTNASADNLLQVWAGNNCDVKENRDENSTCVMVYNGSAATGTISVSVKDILQPSGSPGGVGTGSDETCNQSGISGADTMRTLYFMVLNQSALEDPPLGQASWPFEFDLTAPGAPALGSVGPGEESLIVDFTAPSDATDLKGYRFFCATDEGGCTSSQLTAGGDPPAGSACGDVDSASASSGTATGRPNGVSSAVAVAAEDTFGNVGKLSALGCGTPKEVTGFYEAYRAAGGQAGGGFCGFAPARRGGVPIALALLVGAVAFVRRRR